MSADTHKLEVVYYPRPIPSSPSTLTFLGLIFDKVHFPNVYLPAGGFDEEAVQKEANRIESLGIRNYNDWILVGVLRFLPLAGQLKEFCYFTGEKDQVFGGVDKGATEIVRELDEMIFGPPKENFQRIYETGSRKALPDGEHYIDYPGNLHYPANAMVYAGHHGIPLVNDVLSLPVPAIGGDLAKNNTKLLTTILAMECASLVLPKIRVLEPQELLEVREDLSKYIHPFRLSLLRLAAELNKAISQTSSHEEIVKAARFVVETEVHPSLVELREAIERPSKRWYNRAFDIAKQAPELATSFATMPASIAIAKVLAAIGSILVDVQSEQLKKEAARSGMYYLLKLREANETRQ